MIHRFSGSSERVDEVHARLGLGSNHTDGQEGDAYVERSRSTHTNPTIYFGFYRMSLNWVLPRFYVEKRYGRDVQVTCATPLTEDDGGDTCGGPAARDGLLEDFLGGCAISDGRQYKVPPPRDERYAQKQGQIDQTVRTQKCRFSTARESCSYTLQVETLHDGLRRTRRASRASETLSYRPLRHESFGVRHLHQRLCARYTSTNLCFFRRLSE